MMLNKGRKAFTLIELLVVVAIISLLMAILMPSLGRARKNAQALIGLNNLKQIGMALSMYASENRDYLPLGWQNSTSPTLTWYAAINPYLVPLNTTLTSKVFKDPTAGIQAGSVHYTVNPLLMPETNRAFAGSVKLKTSYRFSQISPMPADVATVFDGSQMEARAGNCEPTAWQLDGGKMFGVIYRIPKDSNKAIATGMNSDAYGSSNWAYPPGGQMRWRQNDSRAANVLFSDGHAETRAIGRIYQYNIWVDKP